MKGLRIAGPVDGRLLTELLERVGGLLAEIVHVRIDGGIGRPLLERRKPGGDRFLLFVLSLGGEHLAQSRRGVETV